MTEDDTALVKAIRKEVCNCHICGLCGWKPKRAADRIEAQAAEIKAILDREADTYRRHDAKVDALEAENERLRETLRDVTPPAYFGESEQSKARWAKARAALGDTK